MKPIYIKSTKKTPAIFLDMETGRLLITGISEMCDPKETYLQLVEKVEEYAKNPSTKTKVSILLQQANTGSLLFLLEVLRLLKPSARQKIEAGEKWVDWLYDADDEHLLESIEMIESILRIGIHKVPYTNVYWPESIDPYKTLKKYEDISEN